MLLLKIKSSLLEVALILICHLVAMIGSFYVAAPLWTQLVAIMVIACSLGIQLRRACLCSRNSLMQLCISQRSSRLYYRGYSQQLSLPEPAYVSEWLLVLRFYKESKAGDNSSMMPWFTPRPGTRIVLFADALPEEKLRQLRVYLRFGFLPV